MPDSVIRSDVTVVVIGRNEGARLERCLQSVRSMHAAGLSIEVIYVDSDSRDGSPRTAKAWGARVVELTGKACTAARGRNAGWKAAAAPLILFLDGDTVLQPDFVRLSVPDFEDPAVAVVWGHRREIRTNDSIYNRVLDLDWVYPPGDSEFCGGDAIMRRSVLEETGGFDEGLIAGEEPELCRRLRDRGYRIVHVDRPMTGHDLAIRRWRQYWTRAVRSGHAYAEMRARSSESGTPLWHRESRRNFIQGAALLLLPTAAAIFSIAHMSALPAVALLAVLMSLSIRTAWRFSWKSPDLGTRLLYGVHSHVQQVPILVGQLKYLLESRSGRRSVLMEYK